MGQLYIPGEKRIKGPWLIGTNELEELDEIFEFIDNKIIESSELEIKEKARIEVQKDNSKNIDTEISLIKKYHFDKKIKRVILISSDEKRLIDSSIKGILKDSKLKDFKPKEIYLNIEYNFSNVFSLELTRRYDGEINYKITCFDPDCREEIKYRMETWLEKNQPNKAKKIWSEFAFAFIFLAFFCVACSAPFMVTTELPDLKTIYKNDINQVIKSGINKENEMKSMELLLKYVTEYKPDNIKEETKINKTAIRIFSISLFVLLISFFKPKTTIGIGRHKTLLKFYIVYTKLVLVTLPAIFIIPPIIEWIKNFPR